MPPRKLWRNKCALLKSLQPERRLVRMAMATPALIASYRDRPWRQAVGAVLDAVAPTIGTLKALSLKMRATRRCWSTTKTIELRLKW